MAVRSWRCGSTADIIDIDMAVIDTAIIYGRISMQGGRDRAADRRSRWLPLGAIPGNACKSTVPVIDEYIVPINDGEHARPRHRQDCAQAWAAPSDRILGQSLSSGHRRVRPRQANRNSLPCAPIRLTPPRLAALRCAVCVIGLLPPVPNGGFA